MKTPDDRIKQAQAEINAAFAKRIRARKLWDEAETEIIEARIKMEDAVNEKRSNQAVQRLYR